MKDDSLFCNLAVGTVFTMPKVNGDMCYIKINEHSSKNDKIQSNTYCSDTEHPIPLMFNAKCVALGSIDTQSNHFKVIYAVCK